MNEIKVTVFSGRVENVNGGVEKTFGTLKEFASMFSEAKKGPKNGPYFVRGALDGGIRRDSNLNESRLVIIDGDKSADGSSAPDARKVHEFIKSININHVIHTSWSQSTSVNKWHLIIESENPFEKARLRNAVDYILGILDKNGLGLFPANEMFSWSQPWFLPSRENPDDGLYYVAGFYDGMALDLGPGPKESDPIDNPDDYIHSAGGGLADLISNLIEGKDIHSTTMKLLYIKIKEGMTIHQSVTDVKAYMSLCKNKDERWERRVDDLWRLAEGAVKRIEEEKNAYIRLDDITFKPKKKLEIPMAPGKCGELMKACYDMQHYPYEEVAFVSTIGMLAGLCGRKFNVNGTGLNLYMTLIMETGMGKDAISSWINRVYQEIAPLGVDSPSFYQISRATGPSGVARSLKEARSQIAVFTEAGLLLQSAAGDQKGLTRYILTLYSCSGQHEYTKKEVYSKDNDSIPAMRAVSLSFINEATPVTLLDAFKDRDSIETGELPRQTIIRVDDVEKPYRNVNAHRNQIPEKILDHLKILYKICSNAQATEDPDAINCVPEKALLDDWVTYGNYLTDRENSERKTGNTFKRAMLSRAWVKAAKFASLAAIINADATEPFPRGGAVIIHRDEWEWAKKIIEYELIGIESFFDGSVISSDLLDIYIKHVMPHVHRTLNNKGAQQMLYRDERKRGIFRISSVGQTLKDSPKDIAAVATYDDKADIKSYPRNGLQKIVGHLVDIGLLEEVKDDKIKAPRGAYRVTETYLRWSETVKE